MEKSSNSIQQQSDFIIVWVGVLKMQPPERKAKTNKKLGDFVTIMEKKRKRSVAHGLTR